MLSRGAALLAKGDNCLSGGSDSNSLRVVATMLGGSGQGQLVVYPLALFGGKNN